MSDGNKKTNKKKIDTMDLMILKELRENSNRPMREIAQKLQMHPNTVLQRVKKLEKAKIIKKYQATINYKMLGYDLHAVVMIKIKEGGLDVGELMEEVSELPEIVSLYGVTGEADVAGQIRAKNRDDLVRVLKKIQSYDRVLKTSTHLVLVTYKQSASFNPLSDIQTKSDDGSE